VGDWFRRTFKSKAKIERDEVDNQQRELALKQQQQAIEQQTAAWNAYLQKQATQEIPRYTYLLIASIGFLILTFIIKRK